MLTTISTYCKIDPKEADQVRDYVALEKLRFMDRIQFVTEIETTAFQIPPLTIQPIVENAMKHGIIEQGRSGKTCILSMWMMNRCS